MSDIHEDLFVDLYMEQIKGALAAQRKLPLFGEITEDKCSQIAKMLIQFEYESDQPATLLIDSEGGVLESALFIEDLIKSLHIDVNAIVVSEAGSAAFLILQMCKKRMALPNARFFIHFYSRSRKVTVDFNKVKKEDAEQFWDEFIKPKQKIDKILQGRSNLSMEKLDDLARRGESFGSHPSVEEMLEWGFLDEVLTDFKLFGDDWEPKESSGKKKKYHT